MPPLTVFSNVWVQVAMKGKKKVLEHHRNLSSAEGKLISPNWCVSSGGISPGFKNSRFWAEETSLLAALFLDGPLLGLTSSLSLPVLVVMLRVSEDKCALMLLSLQINHVFDPPSSLSQRFPQPRCWFMAVQIWRTVIIYIVHSQRRVRVRGIISIFHLMEIPWYWTHQSFSILENETNWEYTKYLQLFYSHLWSQKQNFSSGSSFLLSTFI